jgi:hypothetical protein
MHRDKHRARRFSEACHLDPRGQGFTLRCGNAWIRVIEH